jgi:hypothetical protein
MTRDKSRTASNTAKTSTAMAMIIGSIGKPTLAGDELLAFVGIAGGA